MCRSVKEATRDSEPTGRLATSAGFKISPSSQELPCLSIPPKFPFYTWRRYWLALKSTMDPETTVQAHERALQAQRRDQRAQAVLHNTAALVSVRSLVVSSHSLTRRRMTPFGQLFHDRPGHRVAAKLRHHRIVLFTCPKLSGRTLR